MAAGARPAPRPATSVFLAAIWSLVAFVPAAAQDPAAGAGPRVQALVRQVAGRTVYLDLGTDHGLAVGDTVQVALAPEGPVVGRVAVDAASPVRAVLSMVGGGFTVTRGQALTVLLLREPAVAAPPLDGAPTAPAAGAPAPVDQAVRRPTPSAGPPSALSRPVAAPTSAPVRGRWALEMAVSRSASTFGTEADPVEVTRTYATPALRLDLRAPEAVAGFEFRLATRTTYRYATQPGFDPEWAPRVYEASLERRFQSVPLQLVLGRFHSPAESFSGYWDGVSLRLGGEGLGIGFLGGLQPDRWNQLPTTEFPKASVVVDFDRRRGDVRWRGDVSAHTVWPRDGAPTHTWFGVGQRLSAGDVRLSQELQLDLDPSGGMHLSRLTVQGSVPLSSSVDLRGGVSRRASWLIRAEDPEDVFSPLRDRASVGLSLRGGGRSLSLDAGVNRDAGERVTRSATASASLPRLWGRVGLLLSASGWDGDDGRALSLAPTLSVAAGRARVRAGYRFYDADVLGRKTTTHAPDVSLDLAFARGLRASLRLRSRWGEGVRSQYVQFDLSRIF